MKNLGQMMKQVQDMQARMQELQAKLDQMEITGRAGGGLVEVTLNGRNLLQRIHIDPGLLKPDDVGIVEDLLMAAYNEARARVETAIAEEMKGITGGIALPPGFQMPF